MKLTLHHIDDISEPLPPQRARIVADALFGNNIGKSAKIGTGRVESELEVVLSPHHPVLEVSAEDWDNIQGVGTSGSEVLHIKVTREVMPGQTQVAHVHVTIGANHQDRLTCEVTAMKNNRQISRKSVVADWREPVNPNASP